MDEGNLPEGVSSVSSLLARSETHVIHDNYSDLTIVTLVSILNSSEYQYKSQDWSKPSTATHWSW